MEETLQASEELGIWVLGRGDIYVLYLINKKYLHNVQMLPLAELLSSRKIGAPCGICVGFFLCSLNCSSLASVDWKLSSGYYYV